ncbi:MAG: hypothetical protein ACLUKN_02760 [Bacilli bacterium]
MAVQSAALYDEIEEFNFDDDDWDDEGTFDVDDSDDDDWDDEGTFDVDDSDDDGNTITLN